MLLLCLQHVEVFSMGLLEQLAVLLPPSSTTTTT